MNVLRQCECCSGDGTEGREWFIGSEGEDICARCAAELLGAERDSLRQQLQGAVSDRDAMARQLRYAIDALEGRPWTGWNTDTARAVLRAHGGQ